MADAANLDEMARHSRETAFVRACLGDEKGAAYWRGRARGLELAALDLRAASAKPVTPPVSSDGYTSEQKSIERAWRAAGLPEWFLGNGGTNHNLYAFAEIIRIGSAPTPALNREEADRAGR